MLSNYVPSFLCKGTIFKKIYEAQQKEIDSLNVDMEDLINQCFVETATWGLSLWEQEVGITTISIDSYEFRRSRIKARLRGAGTTTVTMIKNVAESFENGVVEVTEDPINYSFTIKFTGTKGIPPNVEDLKVAINEIKPAFLGVNYEYSYTTWSEVKNITWGTAKTGTWGGLKTREVI